MEYSGLKDKLKSLMGKGYSRFEIQDMHDIIFSELYPKLSKSYFKKVVNEVFESDFVVTESIENDEIIYKFSLNHINDFHLNKTVSMFENLMSMADIDYNEIHSDQKDENRFEENIYPIDNPFIEYFKQERQEGELLSDITWKIKVKSPFQKSKILLGMNMFFQGEKINVESKKIH